MLSLVGDLGLDLPMEHALRQCVIAGGGESEDDDASEKDSS